MNSHREQRLLIELAKCLEAREKVDGWTRSGGVGTVTVAFEYCKGNEGYDLMIAVIGACIKDDWLEFRDRAINYFDIMVQNARDALDAFYAQERAEKHCRDLGHTFRPKDSTGTLCTHCGAPKPQDDEV